jgi:predicted GNAT superfamily acetyltransferase
MGKGYYSACKFLNLLERYERFIAVDGFSMSAGRGADTSMSMDISAHTYMFTGKKAAGKSTAGGRRR